MRKKQNQSKAKEHIIKYFELALSTYQKDQNLANQYVKDAIKISTRTKTKIPSKQKRLFCI